MLAPFEPGNEAAWLRSFRFQVALKPRYCECDGQGHVSNVIYPAYLELSRLQYFKAAGDPEPGGLFAFQHVTAELTLRYVDSAYYDEELLVRSKLVALGRSSATMEQAIAGASDDRIRVIARMAVVRSHGAGTAPWTPAQREALLAFEPSLSQ